MERRVKANYIKLFKHQLAYLFNFWHKILFRYELYWHLYWTIITTL